MNREALFSSVRGDWATPVEFFRKLDREFLFTLDVCATALNAKCGRFLTPEDDGLSKPWVGTCWMNPPYGQAIKHWVRKAHDAAKGGATVVGLLPSRTDTRWFHDHILGKAEVRFVKGRIRFEGAVNSAPFPNMIVVWRPL